MCENDSLTYDLRFCSACYLIHAFSCWFQFETRIWKDFENCENVNFLWLTSLSSVISYNISHLFHSAITVLLYLPEW
jgi:hypothetical protein